jgi:hypothetical protein
LTDVFGIGPVTQDSIGRDDDALVLQHEVGFKRVDPSLRCDNGHHRISTPLKRLL